MNYNLHFSGIDDDEPMTTHIPCEYCDELISIHDLEWHTVCK